MTDKSLSNSASFRMTAVVLVAIEDQVDQLCAWMDDARSKSLSAFRNLREVQPGFPSTTPGNGSVGGGSGDGSSIVERMLDDNGHMRPDDAVIDMAAAKDLLRQMKPLIEGFRDLMLRWGYTTAGEHQAGERRQPAGRDTAAPHPERDSCTHHLKFGIHEQLGPKGRAGLCGWCYTQWWLPYEDLPPGNLIAHRQRGGTVTTAMVTAWLKSKSMAAAAEAQREKLRTNRRTNKKRARR